MAGDEAGVWPGGELDTAGVAPGVLTGVAAGVATRVVGVGLGEGAGAGAPAEGTARIEAHCTAGLTGATMAAGKKHVTLTFLAKQQNEAGFAW